MDLKLAGKRALVTGSTSGIGVGIAQFLAAEGADIVINGRNAERGAAVAEQIRAMGVRAEVVLGSVADDEGARGVAEGAVAALGGIDILINNAGGSVGNKGQGDWLESTMEDWTATHDANTLGAVRMCRHLVPAMTKRGWGRVIHIGSTSGLEPLTMLTYGATKAALLNFSLGLSKKLAGTGVTSNTVIPGVIKTPSLVEWMADIAELKGWGRDAERGEQYALEELLPQSVKRIGMPEDIGALVTFLSSPLADFTTGAFFRVDGGACHAVG